MDVDGNEIKYFSSKFLVQRYLKYSSEDIKLNKKLKEEEIEELNLAGGDNSEDNQAGTFGESIDYDKLANIIVEKMQSKNIITEVDEPCNVEDDNKKPVKKSKKITRKKKTDEEE
jgi:hypothetical protein